jgi:hypothetical protein
MPSDVTAGETTSSNPLLAASSQSAKPAPAASDQHLRSGRWWLPRALGILSIGDCPGEPLDQLLCRVIVTEVDGVDLLIEQHRGLVKTR